MEFSIIQVLIDLGKGLKLSPWLLTITSHISQMRRGGRSRYLEHICIKDTTSIIQYNGNNEIVQLNG